jgi:rare lipoprotein A
MQSAIRYLAAAATLAFAAIACTPEPELSADGSSDAAAERDGLLPPEVLAQLEAEYPRLGETPLPQPQPNGHADPANAPANLPAEVLERVTGEATFYADRFEGRRTASGVPFRQNQMVAAHRAYPFGTLLRVTNTRNNRSVNVRVVDRGPFGSSERARRTVIDVSARAAGELGFIDAGRAPVRVEVLEWGRGLGA